MTLQHHSSNPIEHRKQEVRRYAKQGALWVGGGLVGGLALMLLTQGYVWMILGVIVAVAGGATNWMKVNKILNYKDPQ